MKKIGFCLVAFLSVWEGVFAQRASELKFTDVQQAAQAGKVVMLGQGFTRHIALVQGFAQQGVPGMGATPELSELVWSGNDNGNLFFGRLPGELNGRIREAVWDLGRNSAGIAVRFRTNSKCIGARWTLLNNFNMAHMAGTGIRGLDLYAYVGGEWMYAGTAQPNGKESANVFRRGMDGEYRDYLLYLPLYDGVTKLEIGVDSSAVIGAPQQASLLPDKHGPIVFYGTSVTQGGCATRPGMAYPAIIGRKLNRETVNLGFSGNGRMDRLLADKIAGINASAYVIDCLANCTVEIVRDSTEYFIKTIAGANPHTPVYLVNNYCYPYQYLDAATRTDLEEENALWHAIYLKLRKEGYKNLRYIDVYGGGKMNRAATGPDHEGTVDGTHLTDLGFLRLSEVFCKYLR